MLDTSPKNLLHEAEAAKRLCEEHCKVAEEMIDRYTGRHFREGGNTDPVPENHAADWIASVTPSIVYDNPTVDVKVRRYGVPESLAIEMKTALNGWAKFEDLWRTLQEIWYDEAFAFGVARIAMEPYTDGRGTNDVKRSRPVIYRLDPKLFLVDAKAKTLKSARFFGHVWCRDKTDLLKDPAFNHDAVLAMPADDESTDLTREVPDRNEVTGYELWIPEITLPGYEGNDEFHGTIFTIAKNQASEDPDFKWIREPRPYFGPSTGPYRMFGVYIVPNQVYPLSPLAISEDQVREINEHARAMASAAKQQKSFVAYDPSNPQAGHAAKNARHGEVVPVPGLAGGAIKEITIGGPSQNNYEYLNLLRARLDRSTGLDDAGRGMVSGSGTATEHAEAAQQRHARIQFIQRLFADDTSMVLWIAGWYHFHSEFVVSMVGPEQADEMLASDPEFDGWIYGGMRQRYPDASYDELQMDIEPYSMARADEAMIQRRLTEFLDILLRVGPVMTQMPWIRWRELFSEFGQAMNRKNLTNMIDYDVLSQYVQAGVLPADQGGQSGGVSMPTEDNRLRGPSGKALPVQSFAAQLGEAQRL